MTSLEFLEEKKMFNIAYLTGILVILVPWNSIFIGFLATGFSFPIQQICMGGLSHSSRFTNAPLVIGMTFLALGIIYVVIIRSAATDMWREDIHFPAYHIIIYSYLLLIFVIKKQPENLEVFGQVEWRQSEELAGSQSSHLQGHQACLRQGNKSRKQYFFYDHSKPQHCENFPIFFYFVFLPQWQYRSPCWPLSWMTYSTVLASLQTMRWWLCSTSSISSWKISWLVSFSQSQSFSKPEPIFPSCGMRTVRLRPTTMTFLPSIRSKCTHWLICRKFEMVPRGLRQILAFSV